MFAPSQLHVLAAQATLPPRVPAPRPARRRRRRGTAGDVAIRMADRRDACAVRTLEALDGHPLGDGPRLLAELGGVPVAAMAVTDGTVVADPFEPTLAVVDLLRLRARQLRDGGAAPAPRLALLERLTR